MSLSTMDGIKHLAREYALTPDHGLQKAVRLESFGPAGSSTYIRAMIFALVSRTDDPAKDTAITIQRLDRFFRGLDAQTNDNPTLIIAKVTRRALYIGLSADDILDTAERAGITEEVTTILRSANAIPAKKPPFPTAPQSKSSTPQTPATRPAGYTPYGPINVGPQAAPTQPVPHMPQKNQAGKKKP